MTPKQRDRPGRGWIGLSGIGIEFVAAVGGFTALGWWIDRHFGTSPTGLLICVALGLIGGTYNLVRQALAASREAQKDDERQKRETDESNRS
jgi:F0F1-type ATP synthase assembly protein I